MTHIPYKGSAPALTDLIGGHVALYFSSLPPAIGLVHATARCAPLAVTGPTRLGRRFPDVPTAAETLPGFRGGACTTASSPRISGTCTASGDRQAQTHAMRTALATRAVQSRIEADGAEAFPSTPEQYAADIDHEETKWSEIVRRSGAKAEQVYPSRHSAVIAVAKARGP